MNRSSEEPIAGIDLDVAANRRAVKWSAAELAGRGAWEAVGFLFSWSPRQFWGWRNLLLRFFGARIGRFVHIHPSVRIAVPWNVAIGDHSAIGDHAILYSLGTITVGPKATVSQNAHLCAGTHDYRRPDLPLLKQPITVGEGAWICADAFIGPNARIGDYAIVGARAVAMHDVEAWTIVQGNPAQVVGPRPKFQDQ